MKLIVFEETCFGEMLDTLANLGKVPSRFDTTFNSGCVLQPYRSKQIAVEKLKQNIRLLPFTRSFIRLIGFFFSAWSCNESLPKPRAELFSQYKSSTFFRYMVSKI